MKSSTKKAKKLRIVKSTIQNLDNLDLQEVRAGLYIPIIILSVKPGYPCAYDPAVGKWVSEPGYGTTCPTWQCIQ